jgi:hypothetical protein
MSHEELHNLYASAGIIRIMKSKMRWLRHIPRIGETMNLCRNLVGKPEGNKPLGILDLDTRIILKLTLEK